MGRKNDHVFISACLSLLSLAFCANSAIIVESFVPGRPSVTRARNAFLPKPNIFRLFGSFEDFGDSETSWVQTAKSTPPQKSKPIEIEQEEEEEAEASIENDAAPDQQLVELTAADSSAEKQSAQQKDDTDSLLSQISKPELTDKEIKQKDASADSQQSSLLEERPLMENKVREEEIAKAEAKTRAIDEIRRQKALLLEQKSFLEAKLKYDVTDRQMRGAVSPDDEIKNIEEKKGAEEHFETKFEEKKEIDPSDVVVGSSSPSPQYNIDAQSPVKKSSSSMKPKVADPQSGYLDNLPDDSAKLNSYPSATNEQAAPAETGASATGAALSSAKKGSYSPFGGKPKAASPQNDYLDKLSNAPPIAKPYTAEPDTSFSSSGPASPVASSEPVTPIAPAEPDTSLSFSEPDETAASSEPATLIVPSEPDTLVAASETETSTTFPEPDAPVPSSDSATPVVTSASTSIVSSETDMAVANSAPGTPSDFSESETPADSSVTDSPVSFTEPVTAAASSKPTAPDQTVVSTEPAETAETDSKEVAITPGYMGNFGDEVDIYDPLLSLPMPKIPEDVASETAKRKGGEGKTWWKLWE